LAGVRGQSSFVLGLSVAVERISPWPVFGNFSAKARQKLIFQSAFFAKIIIFILGFGVFFNFAGLVVYSWRRLFSFCAVSG